MIINPVQLDSVQDQINDFIGNFSTFKSCFHELTTSEQELFKETFNEVISGIGDKLVEYDEQAIKQVLIAELDSLQ